jgi:hypothetical protein
VLRRTWITLAVGCTLLATGCGGGQDFTGVYDTPTALASSLGCTFQQDEQPAPGTAASGTCDLRNAPITILFFNGQDDRRAYREDNTAGKQQVVEGSNFLLVAETAEQVRWARHHLDAGTFT